MKKISFSLLLALLSLQSCSGDNRSEANNDDTSLLIRRWYYVSSTYQGRTSYAKVCTNNGHRDYVDFLSPNTANFYYIASASNNICSDQYVLEPYKWVKSGNTVNLTYNGVNVSSLVISELSATTLKYVETDAVTHESSLVEYRSY